MMDQSSYVNIHLRAHKELISSWTELFLLCWTGCGSGFLSSVLKGTFLKLALGFMSSSPPNFHWLASAALRLPSGFALPSGNPQRLCFESATAQCCWQLAPRGRAVPAIITWSLATAVKGLCSKNNKTKCPDRRISRRACVCLLFEICVLVSTRTVLFWKVTRCYIVILACDFLSARC